MAGLSHTLDIARRAMSAQQSVMSVIGHNIANVNTPGYSRQVAKLAPEPANAWEAQSFGNGVGIESVLRKRDVCLDNEIRQDLANLGRWSQRANRLQLLEDVFAEPSDNGLSATMDDFWASWSELSSSPDDMTRRAGVREQARLLAYRFGTLVDRFERTGQDIDSEIRTHVNEFNLLLSDIGNLNTFIKEAQLRGVSSNDLRDRRDLLLDEMSALAPITYVERDDGVVAIRLNHTNVLDETTHRELTATTERSSDGRSWVTLELEGGFTPEIESGSIGGLIELRSETMPTFVEEINTLASAIIGHVNSIHRAGPSQADFFSGTDAHSIAVSSEIENDVRVINSSTTGLPGDNDIALAISQLRDARVIAGNTTSPREFWDSVVGRMGVSSREAQFQQESLMLTTQSMENRRQSGSGVSLDEEMAEILIAQQSYMAAVKIFQAASDMMEQLMMI